MKAAQALSPRPFPPHREGDVTHSQFKLKPQRCRSSHALSGSGTQRKWALATAAYITAGLESPNQGLIGTVPGCVRYLTALVPSDRGELNRRGSLKKQRPHCWKQ
jgi:hypothetical protein